MNGAEAFEKQASLTVFSQGLASASSPRGLLRTLMPSVCVAALLPLAFPVFGVEPCPVACLEHAAFLVTASLHVLCLHRHLFAGQVAVGSHVLSQQATLEQPEWPCHVHLKLREVFVPVTAVGQSLFLCLCLSWGLRSGVAGLGLGSSSGAPPPMPTSPRAVCLLPGAQDVFFECLGVYHLLETAALTSVTLT